jgi:putative tryptophan/tyrosine transport system substrate-binding protein
MRGCTARRRGDLIRSFAAVCGFLLLSTAAHAAGDRVFRLAEIALASTSLEITRAETLPELARLGFQEGRNLVMDEHAGDASAMEHLVQEILAGKPDAIFAIGPDAIRAAATATKTVPIVTFGSDPVAQGFAASFAHPGGNVTGVVILAEELDGKRLDLLHEAVPTARRVAALMLPSLSYRPAIETKIRAVAKSRGIDLVTVDAESADDYPAAFAAMRAADAQALLITGNPAFNRDAAQLARRATEMRLPSMCEWAENARAGCLLAYGPSRSELRRRVAHFVAGIFRGIPPAELPIETPSRFEFAINLQTAQTLGLTIAPAILAQADEVIE